MGLIKGSYEAKKEGFQPGGGSLHNAMSPHGPDYTTFEKESAKELNPERLPDHAMAFMFETSMMLMTTKWATAKEHSGGSKLQDNYYECWTGIKKNFSV